MIWKIDQEARFWNSTEVPVETISIQPLTTSELSTLAAAAEEAINFLEKYGLEMCQYEDRTDKEDLSTTST